MSWALDAALAGIILIIIIINTCKGFKTILNLLVTVVPFGTAYYFGPMVGEKFVTDIVSGKITIWLEDLINGIVSETTEEITIGEIVGELPEALTSFLNNFGVNLEKILSSFANSTIIGKETVAEISGKIAEPVSNILATVAGCVIVFIATLLVMFLVKALLELLVKLPVLKQVGNILGFAVGVVNAVLWMIIICMALGILVDGGFLGENHGILTELTENSHIYNFFADFSPIKLFK